MRNSLIVVLFSTLFLVSSCQIKPGDGFNLHKQATINSSEVRTCNSSTSCSVIEESAPNVANLLYVQDFETPISEIPEISWSVSGRNQSQAIVSHMPKSGSKSVRGNFNSALVDPITNLSGVPNTHFILMLDKVSQLKNWLPSAEKIYISWWFKFDKCHWKGSNFSNNDPTKLTAKFAYLNMNHHPSTSYYLSAQGGIEGTGVLQTNDGQWMRYWEDIYQRAALWTDSGSSYGADGLWHKLSFLITREEVGKKNMEWWIDDKLMTSSSSAPNGVFKIADEYLIDEIGFWHTKDEFIDQSTETTSNNFCNGWQIDRVEVWDGKPN